MSPNTRWSNFRSSLQLKLFLFFTLLTFLLTSLMCTLYVFTEIRETRRLTSDRLKLRTEYLAESARLFLYSENRDALLKLAEKASKAPEIRAVVITNRDGIIVAEVHLPDDSNAGENLVQTADVCSNPMVDSVESALTATPNSSLALIGRVRMVRSTGDLSRSVRNVALLAIGVAITFWLTVSLFGYLLFRRLTRSFNALLQGINILQRGDFTSRINIDYVDEAGRAAVAINNLADELLRRNEENHLLQEERLKLERQLLTSQKLESLGIMAGGIAHDFNNLLQSILGNIELAAMKMEPGTTQKKFIDNAIKSGKRAAHLTDLMLAYTGKRYTVRKKLDLNELVSENAEILRTAATTSVSMKLQLSPNLPLIEADEANVQQVVMNLITNAAESIVELPGIVKLTTGLQRYDQFDLAASLLEVKPPSGEFVFLEVSDNGCGMSAETLARIFDPFFTTKFTGRGLGMSAVIGIIKAHNGALFVESEPGRGTSFRALFPIMESAPAAANLPYPDPDPLTQLSTSLPPEAEEIKSGHEKSSSSEKPLSGTVLIADDEKSVLKICTKMVGLCGFTTFTASDGVEAVSVFREHADKISVVLLDLTMPNMDGVTAMEEIYKIRPDTSVIIASGFTREELSGRIIGQSACGFIRKPYNLKTLETELRRVLRTRS